MRRHEHTFVHAAPASVLARLPRQLSVAGVRLDLDDGWRSGSATPARPARVSWHRGRRHGEGTVEVRPAGWGWSELELRWEGPGPPVTSSRRRRASGGTRPTTAQALAAHVEGGVCAPRPPRRRRRGPALVTAACLVLVAGAAAVWPSTAVTPVSADDALASYRTEVPPATAGTSGTGDGGTDAAAPTPETAEPAGTRQVSHPEGEEAGSAQADTPSPPPSPVPTSPEADGGTSPEPAPTATGTGRPPAGVYRYATDGWEELDIRGSHRRFPEETVQVVHHTPCGFRQTWEPIEERRDEHAFCADIDPPLLVTTTTARSFFGQRREQDFTCSPTRTAADGWTVRCDDTEDGTSMTVTTRRTASELRRVEGREVEVARLRVDAELTGETVGRRRSTVWVRASDGLLVRSEVRADIEVPGPFGRMRYREEYVLDLVTLEPRT